MGHDVEVAAQSPQLLPAVDGHLLAEIVGQLGVEQLAAEQGVGGVAHVVRGNDADMSGGVAGGLDDLKPHPAQGKGPVVGGNKVVGLVDHAGGLPLHRPRGEGEKVAFQGEERGAHPRLGKGEGNFCAILLLKIPVVGAVVHVGVGAKHPRRGQPGL